MFDVLGKYSVWAGLLFGLVSSNCLHAQGVVLNKNDFLKDYVFKGNHLQVSLARLESFRAKLKRETGNYPAKSSLSPGLLLGLRYSINRSNKISWLAGAEAMLLGRNFKVRFDKDEFSPPLVSDYTNYGNRALLLDMVLSVPVWAERRWIYNNRKYVFAQSGIRLNFSLGADYDTYSITLPNTASGFYEIVKVNVTANNEARPWLSIPINMGHAWLLGNNNIIQLGLYSNTSFTRFVKGRYEIALPGQPATTGKYSSSGSFFGVSLHYVFTSANYRIRKAYDKEISEDDTLKK